MSIESILRPKTSIEIEETFNSFLNECYPFGKIEEVVWSRYEIERIYLCIRLSKIYSPDLYIIFKDSKLYKPIEYMQISAENMNRPLEKIDILPNNKYSFFSYALVYHNEFIKLVSRNYPDKMNSFIISKNKLKKILNI